MCFKDFSVLFSNGISGANLAPKYLMFFPKSIVVSEKLMGHLTKPLGVWKFIDV